MKNIVLISVLIALHSAILAQTGTTINFDAQNIGRIGDAQVIPFDRASTLLITKFPNSKVKKIFLFEVTFSHGQRVLKKQLITSGLSIDYTALMQAASRHLTDAQKSKLAKFLIEHPNYLDPTSRVNVENNNVTVRQLLKLARRDTFNYQFIAQDSVTGTVKMPDSLLVPFHPIRPNKYFDIEVVTGLSDDNMKLLLSINKTIMKPDTSGITQLIQQLRTNTMEKSYQERQIFNINIVSYDKYVALFKEKKWDSLYKKMGDASFDSTAVFHSLASLNVIDTQLVRNKITYSNIYHMTAIFLDTSWQDVLHGLLPADYSSATSKADSLDINDRIANLHTSRLYFDSVVLVMQQLVTRTADAGLLRCLDTVRRIDGAISKREQSLKASYNALLTSIDADNRFRQSYMLGSSDTVVTLKTKSAFLLTTDLGFTNIFARDYRNNLSYIPKLFFGINIFFRQVDKNASFKDLRWKWRESGLLSSRNPWQYVSLSLGVTIGNMSNSNFSNLFNTFSLTAGPSIRIAKAIHFTAGAAFLDRTRQNPVISSKQFIVGGFAAFSVDVDFLTPIQKVTDLLFK